MIYFTGLFTRAGSLPLALAVAAVLTTAAGLSYLYAQAKTATINKKSGDSR